MILGVIPARYASSRLPGKPLAMIGSKPMIQHAYESAKKSSFIDRLIIATDDERVADAANSFGAEVMMTSPDLPTGSDRIAVVARSIPDAEIIVNIQGDEPFIPGAMIDQAVKPLLEESGFMVSTLMKQISKMEELLSPSAVKVVFDQQYRALYFSRAVIPFMRDASESGEVPKGAYYKHVGLYAYRAEALFRFTSLPQAMLEQSEKLEQLRLLAHGIPMRVVETELESLSVDTPADLEAARTFFNNQ